MAYPIDIFLYLRAEKFSWIHIVARSLNADSWVDSMDACGIANHGHARRNIPGYHSPCAYHGVVTNIQARQDNRTHAYEGSFTNCYFPGQTHTRREMNAAADDAVMVHGGRSIYDHPASQLYMGAYRRLRQNLTALADDRICGGKRRPMHDGERG